MKVIRKGAGPEEDRSDAPIFFGGKVTGQPIVGGGDSSYFNFNMVSFAAEPGTSFTRTRATRFCTLPAATASWQRRARRFR